MSCSSCAQNAMRFTQQLGKGVVQAAGAAIGVMTGGKEAVPDNEYLTRLEVCKQCDTLRRHSIGLPKEADLGLWDTCGTPMLVTETSCGCVVKEKAKYADEACPQGKW